MVLVIGLIIISCSNKKNLELAVVHSTEEGNLLAASWEHSFQSKPPTIRAVDSILELSTNKLNNTLWQQVSVQPGKSYLFSVLVNHYKGSTSDFGIRVSSESKEVGYHILQEAEYNNPVLLSAKFQPNTDLVKVAIGFDMYSGTAELSSISLVELDEINSYLSPFANYLATELKLPAFDSVNYHSNVLALAKYVNHNLITSLNQYFNHPGTETEKQNFLIQEEKKRASFSDQLDTFIPNSRFASYAKVPIEESHQAYCQSASLSTHDVLHEFNIPANQVHMVEDGQGFHQFFEYWHPYLEKWIIVDPFYGVTYQDQHGTLMGYAEFVEHITNQSISPQSLVHEDVEKFYFNLQELSKGWEATILNQAYHDLRMTFPH